jgi:hypothetical protein
MPYGLPYRLKRSIVWGNWGNVIPLLTNEFAFDRVGVVCCLPVSEQLYSYLGAYLCPRVTIVCLPKTAEAIEQCSIAWIQIFNLIKPRNHLAVHPAPPVFCFIRA